MSGQEGLVPWNYLKSAEEYDPNEMNVDADIDGTTQATDAPVDVITTASAGLVQK